MSNCTAFSSPDVTHCGLIMVDVNGLKSPNRIGKDIFYIWTTNDGMEPNGSRNSYNCDPADSSGGGGGYGFGCAAFVLRNQDY